jgi:lysophospholipase L1-like esterase
VVVAVDLGDGGSGPALRPFELGERLGRAARARVYGEVLPGTRNLVAGWPKVEADRITFDFFNADGGLVMTGSALRHFELLDADGTLQDVEAELVGPRTVSVKLPAGVTARELRYGWKDRFETSLRNAYGQPAAPFRMTFGTAPVAGPARWAGEIGAYVQQDRLRMPPSDGVVFVGSSSIRGWSTLRQDFPEVNAINRGFGGSGAADAVYYFDQIVRPYRPRTIVYYSGENDIGSGRPPSEVVEAFAAFCEQAHAALPDSRIIFLAMKPSQLRWALWPTIAETNALVAEYCGRDPRRSYVDTATPLLNADGSVRAELFFDDGLHLNPEGYRLWVQALGPVLERP